MFAATAVLSVLVALAFVGAGGGKLSGATPLTEIRDRLKIDAGLWRGVGALEVFGGLGLLLGLAVPYLGVAAGGGLALVGLGGAATHARAGEVGEAVPGAVLGALALAAVVLRFVTK
ncbi:MAG TPA: DoxX family protein [Vicinamibacterales bacterium]|nr:DoxX family protein [Vicinamibacterales bacterium]